MGFKNYISMEIGGKVRGLKFNVGTLKCLADITGTDPLKYKSESDNFTDILPYATKIVHAALLSNCLSKKEAPDFSGEDIELWINDLTGFELTEAINYFNWMFLPPKSTANGEVSKDTQPGEVAIV
jgi:hypothetical protein